MGKTSHLGLGLRQVSSWCCVQQLCLQSANFYEAIQKSDFLRHSLASARLHKTFRRDKNDPGPDRDEIDTEIFRQRPIDETELTQSSETGQHGRKSK